MPARFEWIREKLPPWELIAYDDELRIAYLKRGPNVYELPYVHLDQSINSDDDLKRVIDLLGVPVFER